MAENLEALVNAIVEMEEEEALRITRAILADGTTTPLSIMQSCQHALRVVGERYERGEYYLAALILGGEMFKEVADLVEPDPVEEYKGEELGVILLGTVAGDIHDIGKNMFGQSLRSFGFRVIDLGVDVPNGRFLEEAMHIRPDVVCLSGLISIAFESMRQVTDLLHGHESDLGYRPPIVLGGGTVDNEVCLYAGADSWSTDAMEGVRLCQRLVSERRRKADA